MNNKQLLKAALVSGAACALTTPSAQVTRSRRTSGLPVRTLATNNGRAPQDVLSTLLESRKPMHRSTKSSLFYTNDPQDVEGDEFFNASLTSSSSSLSPSTLPIDFDRVQQHNNVLNLITQHVEEQFDSSEFFGKEDGIIASYAGSSKAPEGVASIESSSSEKAQNKIRSASSSSSVEGAGCIIETPGKGSASRESRSSEAPNEINDVLFPLLGISIRSASSSSIEETTSIPSTTTTTKKAAVSETRQIINEVAAIALPSLGGMLLDPIMSLIDTACVGQISPTALAAMAPATSIFQFIFFAFFFMSAATTNLVASNPPERVYSVHDTTDAAKRVDMNERVVSNASLLAVVLGTLVSVSLIKFCDPLLALAGTTPALLDAARPYLLIRAVGIPFVFLATVLQGGSLGRGDAWRPLKIFGAAGAINLIGDVWLTLFKGWGATGAATATVAAQVGAALYYVFTSARLDKGVEASSKPLRDVALVWRGLPSKHIVKTFANVAVALFSRSIGLMLAYSMLTRTAALGGTLALAAHQVTLQVWWLLSFIPEPMSVAAQTLITRDMKDCKHRVPKLIKTLYGMSATLGVASAALTFGILDNPRVTSALVADLSVQKLMSSMVPFAALSQAYCPIATISDGVCIGLGSFSQLPTIMLGSFFTTAVGLSLVATQGLGVVGVWACMNVFLTSRIAGHLVLSTKLRKYLKRAFRKNVPTQECTVPVAA